jgi:hypothetical protein
MRCSYNLRIALAPQRQRGLEKLHWHRSASVVWRICTGTAAPAWFGGFALAPQRQRGLETSYVLTNLYNKKRKSYILKAPAGSRSGKFLDFPLLQSLGIGGARAKHT